MGEAKRRGTREERERMAKERLEVEACKNGDLNEHYYIFGKDRVEDAIREDNVYAAKKALNDERVKDMDTWMRFASSLLKDDGVAILIGNWF